MVKNYSFLNAGLALIYNGKRYLSKRGLADLLEENITEEPLYPHHPPQGGRRRDRRDPIPRR